MMHPHIFNISICILIRMMTEYVMKHYCRHFRWADLKMYLSKSCLNWSLFRSKIGLFFFLCFVGLLLLITDLLKHFIIGQKLPIHEYKWVCRKTNELFFNGIKQVIAIISILMLGSISCEDSVFYRKGSVCELISVCSQQWLVILLFLCLSFSLAHTHTHACTHTHTHTHTHTPSPAAIQMQMPAGSFWCETSAADCLYIHFGWHWSHFQIIMLLIQSVCSCGLQHLLWMTLFFFSALLTVTYRRVLWNRARPSLMKWLWSAAPNICALRKKKKKKRNEESLLSRLLSVWFWCAGNKWLNTQYYSLALLT